MSRFVWFEAYVDDLDAARRLLSVVPGWSLDVRPGPVPYVTIRAGDAAVGGLMPIPKDAESEPHWVAHVAVDDVTTFCGRVRFVKGAVLLDPTELEGVGATALVEDPVGAVVAPFAFAGHPPHGATGPGAFGFATLLAAKPEAGAKAYRAILDWRAGDAVVTEAGKLLPVAEAGEPRGALLDAGEVAGPQWVPHAVVDDLDEVLDAVEDADGDVLLPPTDVPGVGTVALVVLADGLPLGLLARVAEAP